MLPARDLFPLLLAAGGATLAALACGGVVTSTSTPTTDSGADGSSSTDGDIDGPDASALVPPDAADSAFGVPDVAPCVDDAVAPESGVPFGCGWPGLDGGLICWSGAQVCVLWSVGQIRRLSPAWQPGFPGGCEPFPCGCGAEPSCACLGMLSGEGCQCSDDAGFVVVQCFAP